MLLVFCVFALFLYFFFLVDWKVFRPAFFGGGVVALGLYCLIAVAFFLVKASMHTGGAIHH